jgi:uncharacterized protein (TIGR02145 family)
MKPFQQLIVVLAVSAVASLAGLSGTVTDRAGKPLPGVRISLSLAGGGAVSDAHGAWSLTTTQVRSSQRSSDTPRWNGKILSLNLTAPAMVDVDVRDLNGAVYTRWAAGLLNPGAHQIPISLRSFGLFLLRVRVDGEVHTLMVFNGGANRGVSLDPMKGMASARQLDFVDTLQFSWGSRLLAFLPINFSDSSGMVNNVDTNSVSPWNESFPYENIVDPRDGKIYRAIVLKSEGREQHWMAENLNYAGDAANPIGVCYGGIQDSCNRYGRLYRWSEIMGISYHYDSAQWGGDTYDYEGICPNDGKYHWHIPSNDDFTKIQIVTGGGDAGLQLKSISGWDSGNGSDSWGFRVLPSGVRGMDFYDTGYFYIHTGAYLWSGTQYGSYDSWRSAFVTYRNDVFQTHYPRDNSISLRCIDY